MRLGVTTDADKRWNIRKEELGALKDETEKNGLQFSSKKCAAMYLDLDTRISALCWQLIHKAAEIDHSGIRWI